MLKMMVDVMMVEVRVSLGVLGYERQRSWADDFVVLLEAQLRCLVEHRCSLYW